VRSTFRPDRVVANYQDVLYWIEGISTEGVWSDTRFQIEALVEYIEDREYNGMMIRVIRCYSTGEPFIETFDVTSPNGKPGGKTVHVKGYTRKDGTAVQSHDRRPQGGRR